MTAPSPQRRGRKIAMTPPEMDAFLTVERTCRVATMGPDGPHATPLWFTWDTAALWLYSIVRSRRWADLQRDPRIGVIIDAGIDYGDLRGVELTGSVEVVGDVPCTATSAGAPDQVQSAFAGKYFGVDELWLDGRHAWLRLVPAKIISWDFRKLASQ